MLGTKGSDRRLISVLALWLTAVVVIILVAGCHQPANSWAPPLDKPVRPKLHYISVEELSPLSLEVQEKIVANIMAIQLYARKLEALVDGYNEWRNGTLK